MEKATPKVEKITKENRFITLATSSLDGQPWVSPVFYAFDDSYNLYWVSDKNARHSKNIAENPRVAIVIFNSTKGEGEGDAVYIEAEVRTLLEKDEIESGKQFYDKRASKEELKVKKAENVQGNKAWRFYKAVPKKVFKSSDQTVTKDGQYVDTRTEIDIETLKSIL